MKILVLADDFPPKSFGGAGIVAFMQAKELARRGHEVLVITTTQEKDKEEIVMQDGLEVHRLYTQVHPRVRAYKTLYNPEIIPRVKKIISETRPSVVHAHNVHQYISYASLSIAKSSGAKVFLTVHDVMSFHYGKLYPKMSISSDGKRTFDYKVYAWHQFRYFRWRWNPLRNVIIKYYLNKVDKIIAVCAALANALKQNGIGNIQVLHNGIDTKDFSLNEEEVRRFKNKFALNGKKVMFFGGRISRAKGGDAALNLLVELSKSKPEICLIIAGQEDWYVNQLIKQADLAGIKDRVKLLGWLDRRDIVSAYYASDVVLTLSLYLDAFPTINLEAMAASRPIVATCFDGAPEAVSDGVTGYIVDPNDLPVVVSKARALLMDENLSKKLGQNGYKRVINEFQLSKKIDELENIYNIHE